MLGILIIALGLAVSWTDAQSGSRDKPLAFDVVSVKRVPLESVRSVKRGIQTNPGMLSGTASLKQLVTEGYAVPDVMILGGPGWLDSEVYAISARTETSSTPDQLKLMLRAVLAERFMLRVHYETREMPFYALVLGKNGVKRDEAGGLGVDLSFDAHGRRLHLPDIASLAHRLSGLSNRPVFDLTGIDAVGVTLSLQSTLDFLGARPSDATAYQEALFASLMGAVEKQLGLKVEARKGPLKILVIDSADRPTEN